MTRKTKFIDDGDSDSSEGSEVSVQDDGAERGGSYKRRRKGGKESAIYGVFGSDSEDEGYSGLGSKRKRNDWTKAPAFVAKGQVDLEKDMEVEGDGDEAGDAEQAEEGTDEAGSVDSPDDEPPKSTIASPAPTKPTATPELPTAFGFGSAQRVQRSFVRGGESSASKPSTPLPAHEQAHFNKIGGSIGAQMLAKMGWQAGTGLGATGEGIVIPIESKLRPKNMGIAFKGYREKTEQSKLEARRRGEIVSDDEEEVRPGQRKKLDEKEKRSDAWKKPKKVKTKVEHKTYEQIVAEAGQEPVSSGIGQIIDATGRTVSTAFYSSYLICSLFSSAA